MEYTNIFQGLLLQMQNGGNEFIPFPSVQAGYGPYTSMNAAKTALVDMFSTIANVPQGFTFCVIEDGKPQEYWFTKEGDWSSVEPKNTSSSSTTEISNVKFDTNNGYVRVSTDGGTTWTNLVALSSLKGNTGEKGKQGDKGEKGDPGDSADLTQLKLRFREVSQEIDGETVVRQYLDISYYGGSDNTWITVGQIIGGSGTDGTGSSDIIGIATYEDGNQYWTKNGEWLRDDHGDMVRANGKDGKDGKDGENGTSLGAITSFTSIVFRRTNLDISNERPTGGSYTVPKPSGGLWYDGVPQGTAKLWMSQRRFFSREDLNNETAYPWSLPGPATDTADLDFEYSNAPTSFSFSEVGNPTIKPYSSQNTNGWYDAIEHNELVDEANWMAIRKIKNGEPVTEPSSTYGWTILKIRGENGKDGISPTAHFKSFAFRRSNNYTEETVNNEVVAHLARTEWPTGGYYSSPIPENTTYPWSDGIPNGEGRLWESFCIFHSDGTSEGWSEPKPVGDTGRSDIEWSEDPRLYPEPQRRSPNDANPDYPSGITYDGWDDEPVSGKNYVWRAEREVLNGSYKNGSKWVVTRIVGENGQDGTSVTIQGTLAAMYSTWDQARADMSNRADGDLIYVQTDDPTTGTKELGVYMYSASGNAYVKINPKDGDGYLYDGDLWVWDGDSLTNAGAIQGPPGPPGTKYYLHIKYSNDGGDHFTDNYGEDPGDYIGTYINEYEGPNSGDTMDITKYTWQRWTGQDGFGYEYIFILGSSKAPDIPTISDTVWNSDAYQDDDFIPSGGWTDDPQSPYKDKPCCWVCYRKKIDGKWSKYIGQSANKNKAALFSMYSSKGRGISGVTEFYAVGTSDTVAPNLSEFDRTIPSFDPDNNKVYLWNYEVISYDDNSTDTLTDPICIGAYVPGKGIGSIVEYYYASDKGPNDDGTNPLAYPEPSAYPDASWSKIPLKLDKNHPFLWNYEVVFFDDDTICHISTPACIAYYNYTDVEYLTKVFKEVDSNPDRAHLSGLVGAVDSNEEIKAMLNATDIGKDNEHDRLFIASGMNGIDTPEGLGAATFKVYEDGHVEALDVELRGYLGQYFRRDIDVCEGTGTNKYIKVKTNFLTLGWKGLQYTDENGESVNFNSTLACSLNINNLGGFPEGKIIVSNQFYMDSTGRMYYNSNRGVSIIGGIIIAQDSSVLYPISSNIETIYLRNGWVELTKVGYLDKDGKVIVSNTTVARTVYMITAYGGEVFTTNNRQRFVTDSIGAITNYAAEQERASVRNFEFTNGMEDDPQGNNWKQNVLKIYPTNKYIKCTYDTTERAYGVTGYNEDDELYIILPALFTATTPLRPIVPLGDMKFTILVSNPLPIIRLRTSAAEMYDSITASSDLASLVSPRVWGAVREPEMAISTGPSDSRKLIIEITKDPTGDISDWIVDARFLPA